MKVDLADKESLEARRAQQEQESRENCKLISEQKAVRKQRIFKTYFHLRGYFLLTFLMRLV